MCALPGEINVHELPPDGVRFVLPRRPPAGWKHRFRFLGLIVVGLGWIAVVVWLGLLLIREYSGDDPIKLASRLVIAGSALLLALPGLAPLVMAGLAACNRGAEIALRKGRLVAIEHIGPLGWRSSRRLDAIRAFEVHDPTTIGGRRRRRFALSRTFVLAVCDEGSLRFGDGYPAAWLWPLAEDLARRTGLEVVAGVTTAGSAGATTLRAVSLSHGAVGGGHPEEIADLAGRPSRDQ